MQLFITLANKKNIQLKIHGENKINRLVYDKYYTMKYIYPYLKRECENNFKKDEYQVILDDEVFKEENGDTINIRFMDRNHRKYITLETITTYEEISNIILFRGSIINDIFEKGQAYISESNLHEEETENFNALMNSIKDEIKEYSLDTATDFVKIYADSRMIRLNTLGTGEIVTDYNNMILNTKKNLVVLEKKFSTDTGLIIGCNSKEEELLNLSGILYVEGNLIINQNFQFNGIIIINKGDIIVNTDISPSIMGMLIHRGEVESIYDLNIVYNRDNVYYYGIHLPGFIYPQLEVIKKY